jgi:hypothetical protein
MTRLVRMLKIVKERNKLVKYLSELLKIGVGFERLLFFVLLFFVFCHIVACLWIFSARFNGNHNDPNFCIEEAGTWICQGDFNSLPDWKLYFTAIYFIMSTITTVGYGDIAANNSAEDIICIIIMIVGVLTFSFATGSLQGIMRNYDQTEAILKEKIAKLNEIHSKYNLNS